MKKHRTGTVQAVSDGRAEAIIRADEDGADVLAPYGEFGSTDSGPSTLRAGERVTYTREERPQGPIARDIRR